jgi:hypothetical protein
MDKDDTNPEPTVNNKEKPRTVSFSQYSNWMKCPRRWMLDYPKGLKIDDSNLTTCFGTAIHEVVQTYVGTLYNKSVADADSLDLNKMFLGAFDREIKEHDVKPEDDDEYTEFVFDGKNIIAAFTNGATRIANFPQKKYEVVGVELELITELINNVRFKAYIDLVLRDKQTGRIKIYDFKTSAVGWNDYTKEDPTKTSQLLLYKAFYAQKYNVPMAKIDIEFFILKRRLFENVKFPQSRIQKFIPEHNNKMITLAIEGFGCFVKSCFHEDGSFVMEEENYPKVPGKNRKHCKYCPHKKAKNCDGKATKIEPSDD